MSGARATAGTRAIALAVALALGGVSVPSCGDGGSSGNRFCIFESGQTQAGTCPTPCQGQCSIATREQCPVEDDCVQRCEARYARRSEDCRDAYFAWWRCWITREGTRQCSEDGIRFVTGAACAALAAQVETACAEASDAGDVDDAAP